MIVPYATKPRKSPAGPPLGKTAPICTKSAVFDISRNSHHFRQCRQTYMYRWRLPPRKAGDILFAGHGGRHVVGMRLSFVADSGRAMLRCVHNSRAQYGCLSNAITQAFDINGMMGETIARLHGLLITIARTGLEALSLRYEMRASGGSGSLLY